MGDYKKMRYIKALRKIKFKKLKKITVSAQKCKGVLF